MTQQVRRGADLFADHPVRDAEGLGFEFEGLARTLAALVRNPGNETPFTILVRGGWGRGKTTLLKQAERLLEEDPKDGERRTYTIWFNAWKYADQDSVLAGLLGALLDRVRRRSGLVKQLTETIASRRGDIAKSLLKFAAPWLEIDAPSRFSAAEAKRAFYDEFRDLFLEVWWLLQDNTVALLDTAHRDVEAELRRLESGAALAIFLDDLDRCPSERVLDVLRAINLSVDFPGVCFLMGLDWARMQQILAEQMQGREEAFLEKMVQVAFDLPAVSHAGVEQYVERLVRGSRLESVLRVEVPAEPRAGERDLEREGSAVEREDSAVRGDIAALARVVRERHPRHVKRVLNDLGIRLAVLRNTGHLGDGAEQVPERAVLAWHLLHESLPPEEWLRVSTPVGNVVAFLRAWTQTAPPGLEAAEDPIRALLARLPEKAVLTPYVEVLAGLGGVQLNHLVHLGSPPRIEAVSSAARATVWEAGADLSDLEGPAWVAFNGGTFRMGADDGESDERPEHSVRVSPFKLARSPVTNLQYQRYVQATGARAPSNWADGAIPQGKEHHPVTQVAWQDAEAFCTWLTEAVARGGTGVVRLASEAEWEFAARGSEGRAYPWGKEEPNERLANFGNKVGDTTPVGTYPATAEGVYDLAGNVWEWCADWYGPYSKEDQVDPTGPESGTSRVLRGGAFRRESRSLRAACRFHYHPEARLDYVGFRVVWAAAGGPGLGS